MPRYKIHDVNQPSPLDVPGLILWYSASALSRSAATATIYTAENLQTGTMFTAAASGPLLGEINGRPALSFGASDKTLTGFTLPSGASTMLAVIRPTGLGSTDRGIIRAAVSSGGVWGVRGDTGELVHIRSGAIVYLMRGQAMTMSVPHVVAGSYSNNTNQWSWIDGSFSTHSGVTNTPVSAGCEIGIGNAGAIFSGEIAEVAWFTGYKTPAERAVYLDPILYGWARYYGISTVPL